MKQCHKTDNITDALKLDGDEQPSLLFVALHAPWCRHCPPLLENMQQALMMLSKWWTDDFFFNSTAASHIKANLGKIDATVESNLATYFGIRGYPTLKLILSFPKKNQTNELDADTTTNVDVRKKSKRKQKNSRTKKGDNTIYIFDYEERSKTRDALVSYVKHYWFRFIYSPNPHQIQTSPIIWMKSDHQFINFLKVHKDALLPLENHSYYLKMKDKFLQSHYDVMSNGNTVVFAMCHNYDSEGKSHEYELNDNPKNSITNRLVVQHNMEKISLEMVDQRHTAFFSISSINCKQLGFPYSSSLKAIFPPFDENAIKTGPLHDEHNNTKQSIETFVKNKSTPRLIWFDRQKNAPLMFNGDYSVHTCLFVKVPLEDGYEVTNDENDVNQSQLLLHTKRAIVSLKKMVPIYDHMKENIFLIIPHKEERIVNHFGINSFPTLMITDMRESNRMRKYFLRPGDLMKSDDSIALFFEKFYKGQVKPTMKSQSIAEHDSSQILKTVKGDSFWEMVMEGKKHALVSFCAPWCGHCKHLTPKWFELAQIISKSETWMHKVDVMKMDATKNEIDHPSVNILEFPSIYFFPLGRKTQPILYTGNGTDPIDFIAWISSYEKTLNFHDEF